MISAPSKWKVALYLVAIFAAGAVSGWVVAGRGAKQAAQPAPPRPPSPDFWKRSSVYELGLNAEQTNQAKAIIESYAKLMKSTENNHREAIRVASSNRNEELKAILTEEQRQQWDKLRKERDDAWRNRTNFWSGGSNGFKGWLPPGPGPRDKGERGRGGSDKRGRDGSSPPGSRDVTNSAPAQSPPSTTPAEPR